VRLTDRPPGEEGDLDEVANLTMKTLWRTVPAAVLGIAFLSDGQSPELASARLNLMNLRFKSQLPWALSFSFARAIQQAALEIWRGQETNVRAAQQALLHRAKCNRFACRGEYSRDGRNCIVTWCSAAKLSPEAWFDGGSRPRRGVRPDRPRDSVQQCRSQHQERIYHSAAANIPN